MIRKIALASFHCLLLLQGELRAQSQDFSNKGRDFWLCFPSMEPWRARTIPPKMSLFITSDQNSSGTITVGSFSTSFTVTANQASAGIEIPNTVAFIEHTEAGSPVKNKGIHVKVDDGKPGIVLYAHVYGDQRAAATLVLPTARLGRKYFSMNYTQSGSRMYEPFAASELTIVAVEPNTTIRYRLRRNGVLDNSAVTVTLQDAGDILELQDQFHRQATGTKADLTGSIVESVSDGAGSACKNIAVFSGSSAAAMGRRTNVTAYLGSSGSDPLFQQCYPVNTWGKNFGLVPLTKPSGVFFYRVMASEDNTVVNIDDTTITLHAGQFYPVADSLNQFGFKLSPPSDYGMINPVSIRANKPVCVAQFMPSGFPANYAGDAQSGFMGDPDMVLLNPVEQGTTDIVVFASSLEDIKVKYLNIYTLWDNSSSFRINGAAPKGVFTKMRAPNDKYAYLIEDITSYTTNSFRLTADKEFNAISYGLGISESYMYSAGTNLKDLSPQAVFQHQYGRVDSAITCVNAPVQFGIPLNFQPTSIRWDFSAAPNISPNTTVIPVPLVYDSLASNGSYYYSPRQTYTFTKANTAALRDTIKVFTITASANGCSSTDQLFVFPVIVNDSISSKFSISSLGCIADSVKFTDQGNPGQGITKWLWDFGDGSSEIRLDAKPFSKKYAAVGTYQAKLKAVNEIGCASSEASQTVRLSEKPVAAFMFPAITCQQADILFTDASTAPGNTIEKWNWNLDDGGGTVSYTTNIGIKANYPSHGAKHPSLMVETVTGCKSDPFTADLKINPVPQTGFILPEVCVNDIGAQFTDSSKIAEGTIVSYAWNFNSGSPAVSPAPLPLTSTAKNPLVKYNKADNYKVSLTATSALGCAAVKIQDFTVNGANPKAAFDIVNAAPYCGTKAILLKNNATVDFGNVTKVEIFWDNTNKPTVKEIDEDPTPGKIYAHSYPDPASPKSFTIRFVAYSGQTACVNEISKTITVYPQPKAGFTSSATQLCYGETVAFQDNSKTGSSAAASWVWDLGRGNRSVVQNPSKQYNDSGSIGVSMYFVNADGCISDTASAQLKIYPNPKLVLPHNGKVLIGGTFTIKPEFVFGYQLQYLWTPSTWLSSDTAVSPKSIPQDDITYRLTLTAEGGCTATDTIFIKVIKAPEIPNIFSPNGDGINDRWAIKYLKDYPGATIDVYNRFGQVVFRSVGYDLEWDGSYQGKPLPVGTYYYVINPRNGRSLISGAVTLIK
jgi:gliding motility-associated-like protein